MEVVSRYHFGVTSVKDKALYWLSGKDRFYYNRDKYELNSTSICTEVTGCFKGRIRKWSGRVRGGSVESEVKNYKI